MDKNHVAGRGLLYDPSYSEIARAMIQQIYQPQQYTPTECEVDPDTSRNQTKAGNR